MKGSLGKCRPIRLAFSLVELLIVIALICILAALLLPALSRARVNARVAKCASNFKQIGIGLQMYLNENNNEYPETTKYWLGKVVGEIEPGVPLIDGCPVLIGKANQGMRYHSNAWGSGKPFAEDHLGLGFRGGKADEGGRILGGRPVSAHQVVSPANMIAAFEHWATIGPASWTTGGGGEDFFFVEARKHASVANILSCDGHVWKAKIARAKSPPDEIKRRWNIDNLPHAELW